MAEGEWSTNSTEATTIGFWRPGEEEDAELVSEFKPEFTYPIFGDEESIFGYKDLEIRFDFAAHDLRPNVSWSYDQKFKSVGETEALDLKETLQDFVPKSAFADHEKYKERLQADDSSLFRPPGKQVRSWVSNGRMYEIWAGPLTDPAVRSLVERAQVLVPLFIEGGTELQLEDQDWTMARWRVFFLYEKFDVPLKPPKASVYSFVGYCTTYRFVTFEAQKWKLDDKCKDLLYLPTGDTDVLDLPYRGRISQFLIIPPHAHQGHGSMLYATIFKYFHDDPSCIEITVEDPNEAFDDLRDYCDFTRLLQNGTLEKVRMDHNANPKLFQHFGGRKLPTNALVSKDLLASIRKDSKLASRQFKRLIELWLLSRVPASARQTGTARLTRKANTKDEDDRAYYFWRLLVKQRIYKQNKDALKDLEQSEAIQHLESTVDTLLVDYERLLDSLAEKALKNVGDLALDEMAKASTSGPKRRGKRNLVVDDEEDEDSDGGRSKRQKSVADT